MNIFRKKKKEKITKKAIKHSNQGDFTIDSGRLISGGHGEKSFIELNKRNQLFNILEKYPNGVRLGNVPNHIKKRNRSGFMQTWFPKKWTSKTIKKAGEKVVNSIDYKLPDGITMYGSYKGVKVGVKRTGGEVSTVFPYYKQTGGRKNVKK